MKITDSPLDKIIPHLVDNILNDEKFLEERISVDLEYWLNEKEPLIVAGGHRVMPTDDPLIIALALLQAFQKQRHCDIKRKNEIKINYLE